MGMSSRGNTTGTDENDGGKKEWVSTERCSDSDSFIPLAPP